MVFINMLDINVTEEDSSEQWAQWPVLCKINVCNQTSKFSQLSGQIINVLAF